MNELLADGVVQQAGPLAEDRPANPLDRAAHANT
jgi:hypothetical protein